MPADSVVRAAILKCATNRMFASWLVSACLVLPCIAAAQTGYTIDHSVIGGSGGEVSGSGFVLGFTLGEAFITTYSGGSNSLAAGAWQGIPPGYVGVDPAPGGLSAEFALGPIVPNPSPLGVTISYSIPAGRAVPVFVGIYDVRGALVRTLVNGTPPAGDHIARWDGRDNAGARRGPGVYFTRLRAGSVERNGKIVMLE
jgi:hypothetical protein